MAETLHHLESVKPTTQLDKRPAFDWVFTPDFRHQLQKGDPPSLRCLALASGESCSSTVSFWPFFSFLSFFDLKFAAAKLEHFKHFNLQKKTCAGNDIYIFIQDSVWFGWNPIFWPNIFMKQWNVILARWSISLSFPNNGPTKTSICECLLQYGLEVKTSSPPCRRCGWIEVTYVERTGTLHGSTSYWDLTIAATVSNYICHSFMGFGQILLVQLAKRT